MNSMLGYCYAIVAEVDVLTGARLTQTSANPRMQIIPADLPNLKFHVLHRKIDPQPESDSILAELRIVGAKKKSAVLHGKLFIGLVRDHVGMVG